MIHNVSTGDLLFLDDEFSSTIQIGTWEDAISFFDSINSHRYLASFSDRVQFGDTIALNGDGVFKLTVSDTLIFLDEFHPRRHLEIFADTMVLIDWFEAPTIYELYDVLTLTDGISAWAGPASLDTLTLADSLDYTIDCIRQLSDSLTLIEGFSAFLANNAWTPIYPILEETP